MANITIPIGEKIIFETDNPNARYTQEGFNGGFIFAKEVTESDSSVDVTITLPDQTTYVQTTRTIVTNKQIGTTFTDFTI